MADELAALVREADRSRYISALFAPDHKRKHLLALYAFAAELARIPHLVSEPQIGEIRLQWWSDTLDAIANDEQADHPVALALAVTVREFALPVEHLQKLVEARRDDLYADRYPGLHAVEGYVAETEAALMQFAAMVLDREAAAQASHVIGLAGAAHGLARLFARPDFAAKFVPDGETAETVRNLALQRLHEARAATVPASILPALLPAALTEDLLKGGVAPLRAQWLLWRAAKKKKI